MVKLFKRLLKIIFLVSLVVFISMLVIKPPLPESADILSELKNHEPVQTETDRKPFDIKLNETNYKITPLFEYEIKGVVVEEYDSGSWLDRTHERDTGQTKDLCIVWGESLGNGGYKNIEYDHGEFTCFYKWDNQEDAKKFNPSKLSNNHLIPKNKDLEKLIKKAHIGDQVYVKGMLVSYEVFEEGELVGSRGSSTTRTDSGNRACETILVTDFEILKHSPYPLQEIKTMAGFTALVSGLLLVGIFFLVP